MKTDLYEAVTAKIIAQLEAGVAPWVRPWTSVHGGMPYNAITGKVYRGINTLLLVAPGAGEGWMTYKQATEAGAQVRKGEKGTQIYFFKPWTVADKNDADGKERTIPILRSFTVFHTSQVDNLPAKYLPVVGEPIPEADRVAAAEKLLSQARINYGGDKAYYRPSTDSIQLPLAESFTSVDAFYASALHELTHWTGAESRLAREYGKRFGDTAYAREELVAEMGAAFLCASTGVQYQTQHADYLAFWIEVLKSDKRAIVVAAGAAQKAADFVLKAVDEEETEQVLCA